MLIQINLTKKSALMLADHKVCILFIGPINNLCIGSVGSSSGAEIFSLNLRGVTRDAMRVDLAKIVAKSQKYLRSDSWDGRGLAIRMDDLPSCDRITATEAFMLTLDGSENVN